MATEPTLSSLAAMAEAATSSDDFTDPSSSTSGAVKTKEQLRRHYIRALHKVIDEADIIVMVLDARDPEGCRSRLVEEEVRRRESEGKRLVFVLNKIGTSAVFFPRIRILSGYRSRPTRQRPGVASLPPPHYTYPSLQVRVEQSTIEALLTYRSCTRPPTEGLQTELSTDCHRRCCWISERR